MCLDMKVYINSFFPNQAVIYGTRRPGVSKSLQMNTAAIIPTSRKLNSDLYAEYNWFITTNHSSASMFLQLIYVLFACK